MSGSTTVTRSQQTSQEQTPLACPFAIGTLAPLESALYGTLRTSFGTSGEWWTNYNGMQRGPKVHSGSALTPQWVGWINQNVLSQGLGTQPYPNFTAGAGDVTGQDYLSFGYGSGLTQITLVPAQILFISFGTAYTVGTVITGSNGLTFTVTQVQSGNGAIISVSITTPGTWSSTSNTSYTDPSPPGGGTACTYYVDFGTTSGVLRCPTALFFPSTDFSLVAVIRCSNAGGTMGTNPGGPIIGNTVEEGLVATAPQNVAWAGLRVRNTPDSHVGTPAMTIAGSIHEVGPSSGSNLYTSSPHLLIGTFATSTSTVTVWVDGQQVASAIPGSEQLTTRAGNQIVQVGGTGAPQGPITNGLAADVWDLMVLPNYDLNNSSNASLRLQIETFLMTKYAISGTPS